jgi:hypothetical protein
MTFVALINTALDVLVMAPLRRRRTRRTYAILRELEPHVLRDIGVQGRDFATAVEARQGR